MPAWQARILAAPLQSLSETPVAVVLPRAHLRHFDAGRPRFADLDLSNGPRIALKEYSSIYFEEAAR